MTLALYGKSNKRRGILTLAAFFALAFATIGGVLGLSSALATATPHTISIQNTGGTYDCFSSEWHFVINKGGTDNGTTITFPSTITVVFANAGTKTVSQSNVNANEAGYTITTASVPLPDTVLSGTAVVGLDPDTEWKGNFVISHVPCATPSVTLSKSDSVSHSVAAGGSFNWVITATVANGPTTSSTSIGDTAPTGMTFGSITKGASGGGDVSKLTCTASSGSPVSCTLASGAPTGTYTITIAVTAPASTPTSNCKDYTNTATGTYGTQQLASASDLVAVTGCPTGGTVVIKKDDSQTTQGSPVGSPVGGATFKLTKDATSYCVFDDSSSDSSTSIPGSVTCVGTNVDDENNAAGVVQVSGLAAGSWTVTEVGRPAGYGADVCGGSRTLTVTAGQTTTQVLNGTCTGLDGFHNPLTGGSIIVKKVVDPTGQPADSNVFSGNIDGTTSWGPIAFGAATAAIPVSVGSHNVAETSSPGGWSLVGYYLPTVQQEGTCSTNPSDYNMSNGTGVSVTAGLSKVVCVMNSKAVLALTNLTVFKVIDLDGDKTKNGSDTDGVGWQMTVNCPGDVRTRGTDGTGKAIFLSLPVNVTCTVSEAMQAGYQNIGWRLHDDSGPNAADGTGTSTTISQTAGDINNSVTFYNQPVGSIRVNKTTLHNGVNEPSEDGGWHITISSSNCHVSATTKDTAQGNPKGTVVFDNLPICSDYLVSENVNSKPGASPAWSALNGTTSVTVGVTSGHETLVEFTNVRTDPPPQCQGPCTNIVTTPTPPTTPPATPTVKPEVTQIAGERTPGAVSTPIAPSTGNGFFGGGSGGSITLAILGLMAMSAGFAFLALGRKRA